MADRESVWYWLRAATNYRYVHTANPVRCIVERLIAEGRAEWVSVGSSDRVRAVGPAKEER